MAWQDHWVALPGSPPQSAQRGATPPDATDVAAFQWPTRGQGRG